MAQAVDQHGHLAPIQLREIASGGRNLPPEAEKDLARIIQTAVDIFEQGERAGVFEKVTPFLIHMMVAGCMVFYRSTEAARARHKGLKVVTGNLGKELSGPMALEIERILLKAILK